MRVVLVMCGRCGAHEVIDLVDLKQDGLNDIVAEQLEPMVPEVVRDVLPPPAHSAGDDDATRCGSKCNPVGTLAVEEREAKEKSGRRGSVGRRGGGGSGGNGVGEGGKAIRGDQDWDWGGGLGHAGVRRRCWRGSVSGGVVRSAMGVRSMRRSPSSTTDPKAAACAYAFRSAEVGGACGRGGYHEARSADDDDVTRCGSRRNPVGTPAVEECEAKEKSGRRGSVGHRGGGGSRGSGAGEGGKAIRGDQDWDWGGGRGHAGMRRRCWRGSVSGGVVRSAMGVRSMRRSPSSTTDPKAAACAYAFRSAKVGGGAGISIGSGASDRRRRGEGGFGSASATRRRGQC
ncbi:hypothetical protein E2562_037360 [Oryza meyeriana var. granulata]|uniref:Uncharacterized protein n=1 Tax=Oryza meyeriana var. granulata TaxID=110450 RepID=A0A6G1CBB4_9ORYZ|nr:hypothetical protein E2562_037360 [Oryza meyeriana var. granulata]